MATVTHAAEHSHIYIGPASGTCNAYLQQTPTYQRFIFVVRFFARNGFFVSDMLPCVSTADLNY